MRSKFSLFLVSLEYAFFGNSVLLTKNKENLYLILFYKSMLISKFSLFLVSNTLLLKTHTLGWLYTLLKKAHQQWIAKFDRAIPMYFWLTQHSTNLPLITIPPHLPQKVVTKNVCSTSLTFTKEWNLTECFFSFSFGRNKPIDPNYVFY